MRTWVEIPDKQIKELMAIYAAEKLSLAESIRQAISYYLEKKKPQADGLTYQEQVRSEW